MNVHVFIENIAMAAASPLAIATVEWDVMLDELEKLIQREKCLCCRVTDYVDYALYTIHSDNLSKANVPDFGEVNTAFCNLMNLARGLQPLKGHTSKRHGKNRMFLRDLARAEINLMVKLHFHSLIKDCHVCFLTYSEAAHYGVELAACDDVFLTKQAMDYVSILSTIRYLFE